MTSLQLPPLSGLCTKRLEAVTLVRPLIGSSRPFLVQANDRQLYVVKTSGNRRYPNLLANELLGSVLCAAVRLPVAEWSVIELTAPFLNAYSVPSSYEDYVHHPKPGFHYASRMITPPVDEAFMIEHPARNQIDFVQNRSDFLGMYILDTCLMQRDARQAIFIKKRYSPASRAVFIDHGHMFGGPNWDTEEPLRSPCHTVLSLYSGLLIEKDVSSWIKALSAEVPRAFNYAVRDLPAEWYSGDLKLLKSWLHHRIECLPRLIEQELERTPIFRKRVDATMHLQNSRICEIGT